MSVVEILIVLLMCVQIGALVVAGMKGRWVWFVFGLMLWLPAFVGALLPAKHDSGWARRQAA